ncbi:MAG: hypothetical protein DRI84_07415 [Bacteroidetes bacterium]|nr:MAG: hypothetical protein DRI84_07415 [Bacteroidota bacterium]
MSSIVSDMIKNILNKKKPESKLQKHANKVEEELYLKEQVIENKIKLKTINKLSEEDLDKAFNDLNLDEFIQSTLQLKISQYVKAKAYTIVDCALDEIEYDSMLQRSIKQYVIGKVKNTFE